MSESLQRVPLKQLHESPDNPRQAFGDVPELARTIEQQGLIEPIIVRPREEGGYWIVAGARRSRALKLLARKDTEVIIRDWSPEKALSAMLIENAERESLNAIETAEGYAKLQKQYGKSAVQIAKDVGVGHASVSNALALLDLAEPIKKAVIKGQLTAASARPLTSVRGERLQLQALADALKLAKDGAPPASRAVERMVRAKYLSTAKKGLTKNQREAKEHGEEVALRRRVLPYLVERLEQMVERKALPEDLVLRLEAQALSHLGEPAREVFQRRGERPDRLSKVGASQLKGLLAGLCFTLSATLDEDGEYSAEAKALARAAGLSLAEMEIAVAATAQAEALFKKG